MEATSFFFAFVLIFSGAALLSTAALYTRQPIIIAYILLGTLTGPFGFSFVEDLNLLADLSHIGIIFLLFLLGLDMQPQALLSTLRKSVVTCIASSMAFAITGYLIAYSFGLPSGESLVIGAAMMFSSTIIGIKLLPTTVLHHKHTGELMIGILLLQDILAIIVLMFLLNSQGGKVEPAPMIIAFAALPLVSVASLFFAKYVLIRLIAKFDKFHEYIFLLSLGWCLGLAEVCHALGLSGEIGAFIAGVSLATSPISQYIALNLKPLRDFFLVIFFFCLGAQLNLPLLSEVLIAVIILALAMILIKPVVFRFLLKTHSETNKLAWDVGFRLGQISEFSLLISFVALNSAMLSEKGAVMIQAAAILTFVISTYIIIFNYPSPIAISEKLRRD